MLQKCVQKSEEHNVKKRKRKGLKIAIILFVCALAAALGGVGYYLYEQANSGLFFEGTKINDYDVSGMTCKEVLLKFVQDYSAPTVEIREQGETALTLTLEEAGYTIDQMALLNEIEDCMREQNLGLLFSLLDGNTFEVKISFEFEESVFQTSVTAGNFAKPRVSSTDAVMEFKDGEYFIKPETYGNELDDADLQIMVKDSVDRLVSADRPQQDITIDVPDSFYFLPAVTQDDSEMNHVMNTYNAFCKADITLTFGKETKVIDWTVIKDWIIMDAETPTIDEEPIYNLVYELAAKYDTLYYPRKFTTSDGNVVTFESSDYGYQINKDGEAAQLIADIYSNTAVEREPVYKVKGYRRNGRDDLCGNYVEVNLTKQHIWLYKDGKLVVESDMVSGLPKDERETVTGVFQIPYKKSPEVLKGETWEEEVTYWMPFHDGQGLHDAPWRSSFGGKIYQTNGSHGCVNLPYKVAETIYNTIGERYAIILYK